MLKRAQFVMVCILVLDFVRHQTTAAAGLVSDARVGGSTAWQAMPPSNWIILQSDSRADDVGSGSGSGGGRGGGDGEGSAGDNGDNSFRYLQREPIRTYNSLALRLTQAAPQDQQQQPQPQHQQQHQTARKHKQRQSDVLRSYENAYKAPSRSYRNYTHAHNTNTNNNKSNNRQQQQQELRLSEQQQPYVLAISTNAHEGSGRGATAPDAAFLSAVNSAAARQINSRTRAPAEDDDDDDAHGQHQRHVNAVATPKDFKRKADKGGSDRGRGATGEVAAKFQRQRQHIEPTHDDDEGDNDDDDFEDADNELIDDQRLNEVLVPLQSALERVKSFCEVVQEFISSGSGSGGRLASNRNSTADGDGDDDDDGALEGDDAPFVGALQSLDGDSDALPAQSTTHARAHAARSGGTTVGTGRGKKLKKKLKKLLLPLLIAYKLKFLTLIPVLIGGLTLLVGTTGLAGFFFALFTAVMSLKSSGGSKSIVLKQL